MGEDVSAASVGQRYQAHVSTGLGMLAQLMNAQVEVEAEGCHVRDDQGSEFLDCGGYGVFILGHRHPAIVEAVKAQLDRQPLSTRVLLNPRLAQAAEALARIAPDGLEYVFFTNSGAEATELAIKLARASGVKKIVSTEGGFHGKTNGALSVTGRLPYREPFEPLLPGVEFIGFGDASALEEALSGDDKAAVIIEPIQAEGGVIIPPEGYHRDVERICRERGAFFILDEIQTGFGRLGTWWGADIEGIKPDVMLAGKGLGGGVVPVGAVIASPVAFDLLNVDPVLHSSTFAGNPLTMAGVVAAISTMESEGVLERSRGLGERIKELVEQAVRDTCSGIVQDVRSLGLLIAIEFKQDHFAGDFVLELFQRKVIVSTSLNTQRVVRFHPSVQLSDADLEWLASAIRESGAAVASRFGNATTTGRV